MLPPVRNLMHATHVDDVSGLPPGAVSSEWLGEAHADHHVQGGRAAGGGKVGGGELGGDLDLVVVVGGQGGLVAGGAEGRGVTNLRADKSTGCCGQGGVMGLRVALGWGVGWMQGWFGVMWRAVTWVRCGDG